MLIKPQGIALLEKGLNHSMIKVGLIGIGSMGGMLVDSFLNSGRIKAEEIIVSTRTKSKLEDLKKKWGHIHIAEDNAEVVRSAKYIILCVKPSDAKSVLNEIKGECSSETNLISIVGPLSISMLEDIVPARVTKLTPSLNSMVLDGISLVCHGSRVTKQDANYIETLLNGISTVKIIKEQDFELAVELTSCMPGFIACIFDEMTASAMRFTDTLDKELIESMLLVTLHGTAKLFLEKQMSFEETMQRVSTKGGITEEGVKVFQNRLPIVLDDMFQATLQKRKVVHDKVAQSWNKDIL